MNTYIKIIVLFFVLFAGTCIIPQKLSSQGVSVSFQVFYDELSPYGTWVMNPEYGYVWVPNVDPGFTPYATNGYWVFTDDGWTWVSNYSWGWAPFHYGRWYTDPYYGPMWVPDNEWGPGWVTWRRSANYYGWAPIGPGVSLSVAYGNNYYVPYNQYTFISGAHMGRQNINNYYIDNSRNVTIINNSTVINNTRIDNRDHVRYNAGPDRHEIEKRAGRPITPVAIRESSKPGQQLKDNQLQIYRPQVQKSVSGREKPAPAKVATYKEVKKQPSQQQQTQPLKQQERQQTQPPKQQQQTQPPKQQEQHQAKPPKQQQQTQPPKQQEQHQAQPPKKQQQTQPPKQQEQHQAQPPKKQQQTQPPKQQEQHQAQPPKQQEQHQTQPSKQKQQNPKKTNPPQNPEKEKEKEKTSQPPEKPKIFEE